LDTGNKVCIVQGVSFKSEKGIERLDRLEEEAGNIEFGETIRKF
jgi:hypothetical protein